MQIIQFIRDKIKDRKAKRKKLFLVFLDAGNKMYSLGMLAEASHNYFEAYRLAPNKSRRLKMLRILRDTHAAANDFSDSAYYGQKIVNRYDFSTRDIFLLGKAYFSMRIIEKSVTIKEARLTELHQRKRTYAEDDEYKILTTQLYDHRRSYKKSFKYLSMAAESDKKAPEYLYFLGLCYALHKNYEYTIHCFEAVLKLDRDYYNAEYYIELFDRVRAQKGLQPVMTKTQFDDDRKYRTVSGNLVRSKAEALIANFYHMHGIITEYEKSLFLEGKRLSVDFYLPQFQLYHEHAGMSESEERSFHKKQLMQRAGLNVIFTAQEDEKDLENALLEKIQPYMGEL